MKPKEIAHKLGLRYEYIADVKRRWPLFFWNTSNRLRVYRWLKKD